MVAISSFIRGDICTLALSGGVGASNVEQITQYAIIGILFPDHKYICQEKLYLAEVLL